jgi:hypothetical protein
MMMRRRRRRVEQSAECLAGENNVFEENLSHCHFVHHRFHLTSSGLPQWEADN